MKRFLGMAVRVTRTGKVNLDVPHARVNLLTGQVRVRVPWWMRLLGLDRRH